VVTVNLALMTDDVMSPYLEGMNHCCQHVGGHKMHIFTTNIPTFHARYRR
jgi:hypothetical protein